MLLISIRSGDKLDVMAMMPVLWSARDIKIDCSGAQDLVSPAVMAANLECDDIFIADVQSGKFNLHLLGEQRAVITPLGVSTSLYAEDWGCGYEVVIDLAALRDSIGFTKHKLARAQGFPGDWAW